MCLGNNCCPWKISLSSVGIDGEGCILDSLWIKNLHIQCSEPLLSPQSPRSSILSDNVSLIDVVEKEIEMENESESNNAIIISAQANPYWVCDSQRKLQIFGQMDEGSFGNILVGQYEYMDESGNNSLKELCVVKCPRLNEKSLVYEACVQILAHKILVGRGFSIGTPEILHIGRLQNNSDFFAMKAIEDSMTVKKMIDTFDEGENIDEYVIEIILQLCSMLYWLEVDIGLNHRDLTPRNILITWRKEGIVLKTLHIFEAIIPIYSKMRLSLIDFGFACLGQKVGEASQVSLGKVYPKYDACPKEGRDLYTFIAFLYVDVYDKISPELNVLFEKWLQIKSVTMSDFLIKYGYNALQWVYFLIQNPSIKRFECCPCHIVDDLRKMM